jgi:hypothetical protein
VILPAFTLISERSSQLEKTAPSILVTLAGMFTLLRPVLLKALLLMVVTPCGMVTLTSLVEKPKAFSPMLVRPLGRVMPTSAEVP